MSTQAQLVQLLKQKGTGKSMSKSLSTAQCDELLACFESTQCSDVTKSTIWTALMMLDNNAHERETLETLNNSPHLPKACQALLSDTDNALLLMIKQLLAKQDLNDTSMNLGIQALFDPDVDMALKACFLEGLRLKEESSLENTLMLDYYLKTSQTLCCDRPVLIDLATAYDGFNRHPNLILFMAPLLASIGFPTVIHGCEEVSPKRGIGPYKLLKAAGKNPLKSLLEAKNCIENEAISWAYIDQSQFFPEADSLRELRQLMVKRPLLATVEKFCQPLVCKGDTILVTGYTHPPYRQKSMGLLNVVMTRHPLSSYVLLRGVEGSVLAPLDRRCPLVTEKKGKTPTEGFSSPEDYGFKQSERAVANYDITVEDTLKLGEQCLKGVQGPYLDQLLYNCLLLLSQSNLSTDIAKAKADLQQSISSGNALRYWQAY